LSVAPGKNSPFTTRIDSSRKAGIRIARAAGRSSPADQITTTMTTTRTGSTIAGSRNADRSTSPSAMSLVSGFRRCSQLEPAMK
jgi:hypothetical protein